MADHDAASDAEHWSLFDHAAGRWDLSLPELPSDLGLLLLRGVIAISALRWLAEAGENAAHESVGRALWELRRALSLGEAELAEHASAIQLRCRDRAPEVGGEYYRSYSDCLFKRTRRLLLDAGVPAEWERDSPPDGWAEARRRLAALVLADVPALSLQVVGMQEELLRLAEWRTRAAAPLAPVTVAVSSVRWAGLAVAPPTLIGGESAAPVASAASRRKGEVERQEKIVRVLRALRDLGPMAGKALVKAAGLSLAANGQPNSTAKNLFSSLKAHDLIRYADPGGYAITPEGLRLVA